MQLVHCTVNLNADPRKQVRRVHVSVPEIQLLQMIHGKDAVIEINYAGTREGVDELELLRRWYGGKPEIADMIEKLFPGARPNLPNLLAEIGLADLATDEIIEAFDKKKAAAAKAEAVRQTKVATAREKRAAALAEANDAADEESQLIAPPPSKKRKVADPLMA